MQLALYQPDIPQNTGTLLRLASCLQIPVHLIEPAGFALNDRAFKRAGLDYAARAQLTKHRSYEEFCRYSCQYRVILLTVQAQTSYLDFAFGQDDILMLGRESAGVPETVHSDAQARIKIPMANTARSLNVAVAGAIVAAEAMRQLGGFATLDS